MNNVERLCLGTVQFGQDYGINNQNGKPNKSQVFKILEYAYDQGIQTFDTAFAYGEAQKILGEFIKMGNYGNDIKVYTKIKANLFGKDEDANKKTIEEVGIKALEELNLEKIEGIMLHNDKDLLLPGVAEGLQKIKEMGIVKEIGISSYSIDIVKQGINNEMIDMVQMPFNVFDRRMLEQLDRKEQEKLNLFARSLFLQGLLLMNEKRIPKYMKRATKYVIKFHNICYSYEMTPVEVAFAFGFNHKNVNKIVFGVDTLEQLKKNIEIAKSVKLDANCIRELEDGFKDVEEEIILPHLWKK